MRAYPYASERIRIEMVRCGFTLSSLSARTGISAAVLRGILTGRVQVVSTRSICALSSAFGYSAADFIDLLSRDPAPTEN